LGPQHHPGLPPGLPGAGGSSSSSLHQSSSATSLPDTTTITLNHHNHQQQWTQIGTPQSPIQTHQQVTQQQHLQRYPQQQIGVPGGGVLGHTIIRGPNDQQFIRNSDCSQQQQQQNQAQMQQHLSNKQVPTSSPQQQQQQQTNSMAIVNNGFGAKRRMDQSLFASVNTFVGLTTVS
jgi:hypothetical protein